MTQEEKAKRYDEALTKARNIVNSINVGLIGKDSFEAVFPELKESEGEKIKKVVKDFVENYLFWEKNNLTKEKVLAWLEKQSTEPKWCHHKVDLSDCSEEYRKAYYDGWNNCNMQHSQCKSELNDVLKCLINGMKFYYEDNKDATWGTNKWSMPVKYIIEVLEKQAKQKPNPVLDIEIPFGAKDSELQGASYHIPEGFHAEIESNRVVIKRGKQNFSWSKKDELTRNALINLVEMYYSGCFDKSEKNRLLNFLKSLKDRILPQPRQEWSDEDEVALGDALWCCKQAASIAKDENDMGNVWFAENWLKSLRPQNWTKEDKERYISCLQRLSTGNPEQPETINTKWFRDHVYPKTTWKPSDEQITALETTLYSNMSRNDERYSVLSEFVAELKKLKE